MTSYMVVVSDYYYTDYYSFNSTFYKYFSSKSIFYFFNAFKTFFT